MQMILEHLQRNALNWASPSVHHSLQWATHASDHQLRIKTLFGGGRFPGYMAVVNILSKRKSDKKCKRISCLWLNASKTKNTFCSFHTVVTSLKGGGGVRKSQFLNLTWMRSYPLGRLCPQIWMNFRRNSELPKIMTQLQFLIPKN